jgi:hypothetical protein
MFTRPLTARAAPPPQGDGISWVRQTRGGRRRASAARSYLHPVLNRPNLHATWWRLWMTDCACMVSSGCA